MSPILPAQNVDVSPDSIWQNILALEKDSSLTAFSYREEQAANLYRSWQQTQSSKSLIFAFGTWLRNKNFLRILRTVDSLDINTEAWDLTFEFYRKAFYGICGFCHQDYIEKLNEWYPNAKSAKRKALILLDKSYALSALSKTEEEKAVYQEIFSLDLSLSDPTLKRAIGRSNSLKLLVGKKAPNFSIVDRDGNNISLKQFKGMAVYLHFWATWCRPCLAEMPKKRQLYDLYGKSDNVIFIGVNLDTEKDKFVNYLEKYPLQWPQVWIDKENINDRNFLELRAYGAESSLPRTFIIDQEGKLVYSSVAQNTLKKEVDSVLSSLLKL